MQRPDLGRSAGVGLHHLRCVKWRPQPSLRWLSWPEHGEYTQQHLNARLLMLQSCLFFDVRSAVQSAVYEKLVCRHVLVHACGHHLQPIAHTCVQPMHEGHAFAPQSVTDLPLLYQNSHQATCTPPLPAAAICNEVPASLQPRGPPQDSSALPAGPDTLHPQECGQAWQGNTLPARSSSGQPHLHSSALPGQPWQHAEQVLSRHPCHHAQPPAARGKAQPCACGSVWRQPCQPGKQGLTGRLSADVPWHAPGESSAQPAGCVASSW